MQCFKIEAKQNNTIELYALKSENKTWIDEHWKGKNGITVC